MFFEIYIFLFLHKTSCCFYSSFIFLLNIYFSFILKNYIYAFLFINLLASSIYYHLCNDAFVIDQLNILLLVYYGLNNFIIKRKTLKQSIIVITTFLLTIYLFYYGYLNKCYCYGKYGNQYHSLLHILTSIGHLAILFM
jgi:hypothetical protein